jgi:RNA polymerase sigma-70 factor (ECF subfamily)
MTHPLAAIDDDFLRFRDHGDAAALARVFDALAPRLLLLAAHLAPDAAQCEDLVQAVFVDAMRDAAQYDGRRSVASWLAGILRHRAVDRARSERSRGASGEALVDLEALVGSERDPLDAAQDSEWFERVTAAIERIDEPYRAVLALRLVHGLEPRAIAHALGRAPGAVRMQLLRGLEKLRVLLPAERVLGLAAFATFTAGESARGLAAVRAQVLACSTGAVAATSVFGPGLVAVLLVFVGAAIATWFVFDEGAEPDLLATNEAAVAVIEPTTATAPPVEAPALAESVAESVELEASEPIVDARSPLVAPAAVVEQEPAVPQATFRGRVVDSNGAPLRATVATNVRFRDPVLDEEFRENPPDIETDVDGRFEITFDAPGAYGCNPTLRSSDSTDHVFSFRGAPEDGVGPVHDIGDYTLHAAGRVRGRVVDRTGAPLREGREVRLSIGWAEQHRREIVTLGEEVELDALDGSFETGRFPPGAVQLSLFGPGWRHQTLVEVGELDEFVELVYGGALPSRSIVVQLRPEFEDADLRMLDFDRTLVRLLRDGLDTKRVPELGGNPTEFVFGDIQDGSHTIAFDDERFEGPLVVEAKRGETANMYLRGGATVFADVRFADGSRSSGHSVSVRFDGPLAEWWGEQWLDLSTLRTRQPSGESYPGLWCVPQTLRFEALGTTPVFVSLTDLERGETRRIDVVLEPDRGITGVVLDASGVPIAGVQVRARESRTDGSTPFENLLELPNQLFRDLDDVRDSPALGATSGPDGRFEILGVPTTDHDVEARLSDWVNVRRSGCRPGDVVELQLPAHTIVRGRIVGVTPERLRGFYVSLLPVAFEPEDRAPLNWPFEKRVPPGAVDEQGAFELLGVPREPVELFLHYPKWIDRTGSWSPGVAYTLGTFDPRTTSLDGLVFDVSRFGPARITVRATWNGAPFVGAEVRFSRARSEGVVARYSPRLTLDEQGVLVVDFIDAATWEVSITDPTRRFGSLIDPELVLVAGDDRRIDFALETVPGVIEIVGEDGTSLVGRTVHLSSGAQGTRYRWQTWFEIESNMLELTLPVGPHTLMLQRLDRRWGSSVEFDWTANGPSVERVVLLEEP